MLFTKIDIPRRSRQCYAGDEPFSSEMEYFSLLEEKGDEFERKDFCTKCWEKKAGIFWKSKVPSKPPQTPLQNELEIFRDIENDPQLAFLFSLYLARKKCLVLRHETEDSLIYEVLETEEMLTIQKVDLKSLDVPRLQDELVKRLACIPS